MYNLITKSATVVSKQKNTHTLLVVTVYKVRLIHLVLPQVRICTIFPIVRVLNTYSGGNAVDVSNKVSFNIDEIWYLSSFD